MIEADGLGNGNHQGWPNVGFSDFQPEFFFELSNNGEARVFTWLDVATCWKP